MLCRLDFISLSIFSRLIFTSKFWPRQWGVCGQHIVFLSEHGCMDDCGFMAFSHQRYKGHIQPYCQWRQMRKNAWKTLWTKTQRLFESCTIDSQVLTPGPCWMFEKCNEDDGILQILQYFTERWPAFIFPRHHNSLYMSQ